MRKTTCVACGAGFSYPGEPEITSSLKGGRELRLYSSMLSSFGTVFVLAMTYFRFMSLNALLSSLLSL